MPVAGKPWASIVGVGATPYYRRGETAHITPYQLAGRAILAACEDAGLSIRDIDGFAYYSMAGQGYADGLDTAFIMEMLGIPEIGFSATLTSGGGGSAGSIGLASAAINHGDAKYVLTLMVLQQPPQARLGTVFGRMQPKPENAFTQPSGLVGPGHLMSVIARRHMHLYGTRREAFAEVAISTRLNAMNRPEAVMRDELTLDEYFRSPIISDPLCRHDFCLETEGAIAVITTSPERAADCRQRPVHLYGAHAGGSRDWGRAFTAMQMSEDQFATAGNRLVAQRLYERSGLTPDDIDVALLYDHFTPMVIMQLEDYGFCSVGEGGAFVESGAIRYRGGSIPVNTHGGQLSECYIIGMTHIREAVEQIRGVATNQVADCELALVTGGPAPLPVSGIILGR